MNNSRLVYSTDGARAQDRRDAREERSRAGVRPGAARGATLGSGNAHRGTPAVPNDGVVRLFRERGGRGGKIVTVIRGLPERGAALEARAAELKRLCGAGGAVKDGVVEIQGDHRERLAERLRTLGYTVKLAGG